MERLPVNAGTSKGGSGARNRQRCCGCGQGIDKKWKNRPPPPAPVRAAAARAIDKDVVVVMEELTNEAEVVTEMLDLAAAIDILQILCTSFTLLHIKLGNF